ncbi:hypothetical protein Q5425_02995 [Amycolatopsis sp. A133]|uniref:hypothetical protein n=1 Tax=Amycolatopsis sp. A133 TaxID=3064472 RepID=UPI0027FAA6F7|nr:hypothetical protein [Amycolatopsis sp. A133]MDQ7802682.1 hypothetical protein [Amycolatopsis sp. A133]
MSTYGGGAEEAGAAFGAGEPTVGTPQSPGRVDAAGASDRAVYSLGDLHAALRLNQLVPRAFQLDDVDAAVGADERDVLLVEGEAVAPFQDTGILAAEEPVLPTDHLLDFVFRRVRVQDEVAQFLDGLPTSVDDVEVDR